MVTKAPKNFKHKETLDDDEIIKRPRQTLTDAISNNRQGLDALAEKLTDVLFSKDKLLMTARLTKEYALMVIRNTIVSKFFIGYYANCRADIKIIPISVPPFYRKVLNEEVPTKQQAFQSILKDLNDELLQITIGFDGLGRGELKTIVTSLVGKSLEDERKIGIF